MNPFVLRKTLDASVEAERERSARAVYQLACSYGDALNRVTALQKELSAWVFNKAENITPRQAAQMFYAQNDEWQAEFFNYMQEEVLAVHEAMPPAPPGMPKPHPGIPAGEGQWYHMARHLNESGFETIEAMIDHAEHWRSRKGMAVKRTILDLHDQTVSVIKEA